MNTHKRKKLNSGISLLELLLSFTIITILLLSASRYYTNTQTARRVQAAMDATQAVYYAGGQYIEDKGTFISTTAPVGTDMIATLIAQGLLPSGSATSPWSGTMTAPSVTATQLKLIFPSVPAADCSNTAAKINKNPNFVDVGASADCTTTQGGLTIIFSDYTTSQ